MNSLIDNQYTLDNSLERQVFNNPNINFVWYLSNLGYVLCYDGSGLDPPISTIDLIESLRNESTDTEEILDILNKKLREFRSLQLKEQSGTNSPNTNTSQTDSSITKTP